MVSPSNKIVSVMLLLLALTACQSSARKDPVGILKRVDEDIRKTEVARESDDRYLESQVERATRPIRVVRIPRSAQWLRDEVSVRYENTPVRLAIATVLDGRPFRVELQEIDGNENKKLDQRVLTLPTGEVVPVTSSGDNATSKNSVMLVTNPPEASTIKQHLDAISSQAGWSYSVANGVVVFSDSLLQTFAIKANTRSTAQGFRFANQSASSGSDSDSADLFAEMRSSLLSIVPSPNTFTINQAANSVSVKATQSVLRQVGQYVDQLNYSAGRRVAIRLDIYDINLSALGQRSFDFDMKSLLADSNSLTGFIADFAVAGSGLVNTQSAPTSLGLRVDNADSTLNGASALLRVLRGKGAVTKRTAKEFVVSNNEQVNEIRTRITPYVSGVTVDQTTSGITQSNTPTIETKEANTGTAIQLYPTISGDRVYIQMTIEDSSLVRFDDFEFGGGEGIGRVSGKLPVTEVAQSQYEFAMIDGETIAVAGSVTSSRAHDVVNGSLIPILGDSVDKNETRTQSLIFVTSNILD